MENTFVKKDIPAWRYVAKVMLYHVITYIICGIIFSQLFHYQELFAYGNMKYFMQPADSARSMMGPLFQVVRGLLFGVVLLLLRKNILTEKNGFLKLYALILIIGIINTPGPAPGSIEGMVYTQVPWKCHILGLPEILLQTFWFSYLVYGIDRQREKDKKHLPDNLMRALVNTVICVTGYSLSGIVIALLLRVDVMRQAMSLQSCVVLGITGAVCFLLTLWYMNRQQTGHPVYRVCYYAVLYIICAVCPFIINMLTDSPFGTSLSLIISGLPVIAMAIYMEKSAKRIGINEDCNRH
ncbi:MAG: hypothetical protein IKR47_00645 [Lachnospiraceae bacterium]|nr:hypothetical protein [Parasporobacterium sp.]MBR4168217.1 hypothetical protein [Lachnospiraceae bacterium]